MTARALRACTASALAIVAAACDLRADFSLHDTEGWTYRVKCTQTECASTLDAPYAARPQPSCAGGAQPGFVLAGRGVVVACHACVGSGPPRVDLARCRALRCETDRDCAPFHGTARVRCTNGLCQVPSRSALDPASAAGLCLAGAGPSGSDRPAHVEDRLALARAACDDATGRCRAPQGCRAR